MPDTKVPTINNGKANLPNNLIIVIGLNSDFTTSIKAPLIKPAIFPRISIIPEGAALATFLPTLAIGDLLFPGFNFPAALSFCLRKKSEALLVDLPPLSLTNF